MTKPCTQCSHPTRRHDGLCPNCYYVQPNSDNPQSGMEAITIPAEGYICKCGENRTRALILMCKGGLFLQPGPPRTNGFIARDSRAMRVGEDPSLWFAQCHNCNQAINNRPPGRPKKYTDEERLWRKRHAPGIARTNLLSRVVQSYGSDGKWPTCMVCDNPATRTLYVGEFGKAPVGHHGIRCRRLALTDPYWHSQFLPYCDYHEIMNIGQRNHIKRKLLQEQISDANYRSSLSLQELEQLNELNQRYQQ